MKTLRKEDVARYWIDEIERAEKVKEEWKEKFHIDECYSFYLGDQKPCNYAEEDWFTINLIYSSVKSQIPSLYFKDPYFFVRMKRSFAPDRQTQEMYEKVMSVKEGVINYIQKENELVPKGQSCILDAFFQYGVLKSRYVPTWEENPDAGKAEIASNGEEMVEVDGTPVLQPGKIIKAEKFVWDRVNPNNILVDADAGTHTFNWVAHKIIEPLETVRKNKSLKNTSKSYLEADCASDDMDEDRTKEGKRAKSKRIKDKPDEKKRVTRYEIYDLSRQKMWVIAVKGKFPLMEKKIPHGIEDHPFSFLRFNENPGEEGKECWYPIPEVFNQLGPQKEFNLAANDIAIHRKRYKRKYGYAEGDIEDEELSKFEDPIDGLMVKFNTTSWQSSFAPIQDAPLDQAVVFDRMQLKQDFNEMAATPSAARGAADADTATEAEIMENRLQIKESDKQFVIRRFLINAARKMHQLLEGNLAEEGAVRVTGPKGEAWVRYGPRDFEKIEAEIEFDIDVASMSPRNNQVERAQFIQFTQAVLQAPMVFQSMPTLKKFAEMFDIRDEAFLEDFAKGLKQLGVMMQQQDGVAQNMPGGGNIPTSMGNLSSAAGGAS